LLGVRSGTDSEIEVRLRHFQLLEKDVGHGSIVVLAGVDQGLADSLVRGEGAQNGRRFDEIRLAPTT
jgi:hypothetical protein